MKKYALCDHLSEQIFRATGDYFANFSSSIGSISEEIVSQLAAYLSSTSIAYQKLIYIILPPPHW